jgi:hypothetical protein
MQRGPGLSSPPARHGRANAMRYAAYWTIAFSVLTGLSGCEECPTDPEPDAGTIARITGRIVGGGTPVSTEFLAIGFSNLGDHVTCGAWTDSLGYFQVDLPPGQYWLALSESRGSLDFGFHPARGLIWPPGDTDSVTIAPGQTDLLISAAAVRLQVYLPDLWQEDPDPLEADRVYCTLMDPEGEFERKRIATRSTSWVDGWATMEVPLIPAGIYRVKLHLLHSRSSVAQEAWLTVGADGDSLLVQGTGLHEVNAGELRIARLTASATRSWQALGVRPSLVLYREDSTIVIWDRSAEDGTFEVPMLEPAPIRCAVEVYPVRQWIGGDDFASATTFYPQAGETLHLFDHAVNSLRVHLHGPGSNTSFDGRALLVDGSGLPFAETRVCSGGGNKFLLGNVPAGTYFLKLTSTDRPRRFCPQWYASAESLAAATPIQIPGGGGYTEIDMHLLAGGQIQGRILDADFALPGRAIQVESTDGTFSDTRAATVSPYDSSFVIPALPNGAFRVGVKPPSSSVVNWYPGTTDPDEANVILIEGHGRVEGVEWRIGD